MANINTIIPPGSTSPYAAPLTDSHQNVGLRLTNPNTVNRRINMQRMQDNMQKQLTAEFEQIDLNHDGTITSDELHYFFVNVKGITDEDVRNKIIDEIFEQIDLDGNGSIQLNEFISMYIDIRNRLIERKEDIMITIVEHAHQEEEVRFKLAEAEKTEQLTAYGIRADSKLKVHIVDAQNLEEGSYLVKVMQDNAFSDTNVRLGSQPIWNEAIVFDIKDPYQPVVVTLINQQQELILESQIRLTQPELTDYSNQGQEIWCYSQFDEREQEIETGPKLRIRINYNFSDVQRFGSLLEEWYQFVRADIDDLNTIQEYLDDLTTPFGFLKHMAQEKAQELTSEDRADLKEQKEGDTNYHAREKVYEQQLDSSAKNIANSMGYRTVPWLGVTYFFLVVQMLLSMLTQFHRKDMMTITVCALAFFALTFPYTVRRSQFRMLVAMVFLSIGQDLLWFALNRDEDDDEDDGGVERSVKAFSRKMSYLSFIWRLGLALVLWKASLDFISIVKGKGTDGDSMSLEERVQLIIQKHQDGVPDQDM